MNYHTIVTHESPDLDAILSCLLLKKYGEEKFPGVGAAKITFISAGTLYLDKKSNKLLREGIITVDTGGGKFDTHPEDNKVDESKIDRSASDLIGEYLDILGYPELKKIIRYTKLHDSTGFSLTSKDQIHHLTSLQTILYGLKLIEPHNDQLVLKQGSIILESIISYYSEGNTMSVGDQNKLIREYVDDYVTEQPDNKEKWYEKLAEWKCRLVNGADSAFPAEEIDIVANIRTIVIGAHVAGEANGKSIFRQCMNSIVEREKKWLEAIKELDGNTKIERIGNNKICYLNSVNPLIIKASRFLIKADLIIYHESNTDAISIMVKRNGSINSKLLFNLVRSIRLAECIERKVNYKREDIISFGKSHHWFYHQSGNLIINGSDKSKSFEKSAIKIEDMLSIIYFECSLFLNQPGDYNYPEKFRSEINKFKLTRF